MIRIFNLQTGFLLVALLFVLYGCSANSQPAYRKLIQKGEFKKAKADIEMTLKNNPDIDFKERQKLLWEIERMERIKKDFTATREDVLEFIRRYIPDVNDTMLAKWEKSRALEMRVIDGEKRYFNYAARNLFRIDPQCKTIWEKQQKPTKQTDKKLDLNAHDREIIDRTAKNNGAFVLPVRMHIKYTITLKPDMVPAGEIVRCWIPFPREIPGRQTDIELVGSVPQKYTLAPPQQMQRTIYFEKESAGSKPTVFSVEYAVTQHGTYTHIDPDQVVPVEPDSALLPYVQERPPHIVFGEALRALSRKIVGNEKNPYRIAQKIFQWIDGNIPWASAREYSTIRNISAYAYENGHGDCGIQTLLFIALLRMNGIPARWQSGWEFQPPHDSMHDWGMVYFEPYGWMPMDVTYGLRNTDDEKLKWFYLQGMDSYRLIFNDDFGRPFYIPKKHFRSETVDSQRGELEWKGGNLYFDQWEWKMEWKTELMK